MCVVSSRDRFINQLDLIGLTGEICRYELSHFNVVGEDVERKIKTLGNSNKFILFLVFFSSLIVHIKLSVSKSTTIKGSKRLHKFTKLIVILEVMNSETI